MALESYSSKKIVISWGEHIVQGYDSDNFVTVEYPEDDYTPKTGADGSNAVAENPNTTVNVTIRLMQTSASNTYISAQRNAGKTIGRLIAKPLLIKDLNGQTLVSIKDCYVRKPANIDLGKEVGVREWAFTGTEGSVTIGGNRAIVI